MGLREGLKESIWNRIGDLILQNGLWLVCLAEVNCFEM